MIWQLNLRVSPCGFAVVTHANVFVRSHDCSCLSGMKSKVDELKAAYDREECPCLEEYDPHTVASLLKQYLRELPENLLARDLTQRFEDACGRAAEAEKVSEFQRLLAEVPFESRLILSWLITHMEHVIAREADTKMNIQNISIVLNPTVQVRAEGQIVLCCLDVRLKKTKKVVNLCLMGKAKILMKNGSSAQTLKIRPPRKQTTEFLLDQTVCLCYPGLV